jgi:hypothetical protein
LIESDGSKGLLVLGKVIAQYVEERLGLLWAEIDALKVLHAELVGRILSHGTEDKKEVPDGHPDLNAIGIAIAIIRCGGKI